MNLAQRVALNTAAQVASQVIGVVVSLVTLRITTGYLGVDEYGELAIIIAVAGVVVAMSELGVATTLSRELVKTPENVDRLAGNLLSFRVVSTLALALATLAIVPALPYSSQTKLGLAIYLVGVVGWSLASFPRAFFQTRLKLHLQATIDLATRMLLLGVVSVVVVLDLGFYALVSVSALVGVAGFALAFWFLLRFWRPHLRWERDLGLRLARDTLSVGVVSFVGLLHFRVDAVLLSLLAPARDVGIYSIAYRFVDQSIFLAAPFILAVFPILARLVHEGPGRADKTINRSFQVLALASIAVVLATVTLAQPIVHLMAGPDFDDAVNTARILAFCLPSLFCTLVFYHVCIAVNRQRDLIWVGVACLTLNVSLNLILIPRYTYNGAAAATVISEGLAFAGSYWLARRSLDFHFELGFLARAGAATAVAGLVAALVIERSELAAFALGEFALVSVAYLAGAVRPADLSLLLGRQPRADGV
jgi:O-antigen/teichoic acid export membrane protein